MSKRSMYFGASLAGALLLLGAARAGDKPIAKPVQVYAAIGCGGTYVAWVLFSSGKMVAIDESSGVKIKQLAEQLAGVPSQVRRFDTACPIIA